MARAAGQDAPRPKGVLWTYGGITALIVAFGAIFIAVGISQYVKDSALEARGRRVIAQVDSVDISHNKHGATSHLDVHFRLPDEKVISVHITYEGDVSSDFGVEPGPQFGTTIPVIYDPNDPTNAQLPGGFNSTRDAGFVIFGCIVLIAAFVYGARQMLWIRRLRRLPRIVAPEPMQLSVEHVGSGRSSHWVANLGPTPGCTIEGVTRFSVLAGQGLRSRFAGAGPIDARVYAGPEDRMLLIETSKGYVWASPRWLWPLRHVRREHVAAFAAAKAAPAPSASTHDRPKQSDMERRARGPVLASWYDAPPVDDADAVITAYEAVLATRVGHRVSPQSLLPHPDTTIGQAILSLLNAKPGSAAALQLTDKRRQVLNAELIELAGFIPDADAEIVSKSEQGQADEAIRAQAAAILERVEHAEAQVIDGQFAWLESLDTGQSVLGHHPIAIGATDDIVNGIAYWSDATAITYGIGLLSFVLVIIWVAIGGFGVASWIILVVGLLLWIVVFMAVAGLLLRLAQRYDVIFRCQVPLLFALALASIGAFVAAAAVV